MTHLNIQQGLNIEVVSTNLIKKLYEAALSVPEPLEGELDAAYMSGNLLVAKTYRSLVEYLTNRFDDLHINVTDSYYIPFEDNAVLNVLLANNIGSDGIGITEAEAANATFTSSTFLDNTDITSFNTFEYFTKANTNPPSSLFKGCSNLTEIDFSAILKIGSSEFKGCSSLTGDLSIPNLSEFSGDEAFRGCAGITKILNLGNITSLPLLAFRECTGITEVTIPSTCTTLLNWGVFSQCSNLTKVIGLLNLTKIIGAYLFSGCDLDLTTLPSTWDVVQIGPDAFNSSKIHGEINCPKLSSLGDNAFWGCGNITKLKCLGKVTQIPGGLISSWNVNNSPFTEAYIPFECTSIGNQAFRACENMTTIKQYTDSVDNWVEGLTPTYTNISRITTFGNECFRGCSSLSLTNADITNAISIGKLAFSSCFGLSGDIVLPNVNSIGDNAFYNCTGITSIDFTGSTFTAVGASTFRGCSNLTKLVLPTTVTTIGNEWVVDVPRLITVEGTDNIANYGTANQFFRNPIIGNPLKTGFVSDRGSLFKVQGNSASSGMSLHSLYEPLRKNTPVGTFVPATNTKESLFWSSLSISANANIGLYYLKDIETFGYMAFYGTTIDNLVINNVTPPTLTTTENSTLMGYTMYQDWGNVIFGPNSVIGTLWVPDSAVSTYQADPLYSGLTIKGINTKTNGVDYDLPRYATYADWKTAEAAAVAQGGHAPQGLIEAWM